MVYSHHTRCTNAGISILQVPDDEVVIISDSDDDLPAVPKRFCMWNPLTTQDTALVMNS